MNLRKCFLRRRFTSEEGENVESRDEKNSRSFSCLKNLLNFCKKSEKHELAGFRNFIRYLYKPTCPSSLGVVRALFGLMMMIDIPDERGLWDIDSRFGDSMRCRFPLFDWLSPLPLEYMGLLYCIMWLGALGICLGFQFQMSCLMFVFPYWYIYLLDKTLWNNHSYLYGLIATLFTFTQANHSFSLDALLKPQIKDKPVPLWNYIIIRFQFFLLYFYAGVKKFDPDWIGGYSMTTLGLHWVFNPFRLFLSDEQIDFWIVHIFGFIFDLSVGFFLMIDKTRPVAMLFSTAFHLMNSCMFHIGQFPYVCLVTTPIFCNYDWPDQLKKCIVGKIKVLGDSCRKSEKSTNTKESFKAEGITRRQKITCCLLALYAGFQLFLPYSHFITEGYNNWTNGLYGYSWDMMVKNWYSNVVVIRVIDNQSKEEYFLDPEAWVGNTRYSKHGDMLIQYAKCLKRNLNSPEISNMRDIRPRSSFKNISVYVDIWCSLNGRFQQRMFDPRQDLLKAEWSPFKKITWLMPLLSELSSWRKNMAELEREVFKWSNYSDVLFVADFPGLHLENYISPSFTNITLSILRGTVVLEQFNETATHNVTLYKGDSIKIKEGTFHKVHTISEETSCYMYTYDNYSVKKVGRDAGEETNALVKDNNFTENLNKRIDKFWKSLQVLRACLGKLFFSTPIHTEKSVKKILGHVLTTANIYTSDKAEIQYLQNFASANFNVKLNPKNLLHSQFGK